MGGSQKSKRVTWASDVNLCQVKLFLLEESPSHVGMGTQDHLQAKALCPVQSGGIGSDDNLPPGFEAIQPANLWRAKLSQIPLMKWRCPPRFEVNSEWRVVAGEESKEMEAENEREMRVFEAIYPPPSAIPPNPSALVGVEDSITNDQNTPLVPITPIEDEDAALDTSFISLTGNTNPMISQPQLLSHGNLSSQYSATINPHANGISATGLEPDIVAVAQAALTSIISKRSNSDQENLIDPDLLLKIISNPKMVEQIVTSHGASSSSMQKMPNSSLQTLPAIGKQKATYSSAQNMPSTSTQYTSNLRSPPKSSFDSINIAISRNDPFSAHITGPEHRAPSMGTATGPFYPPVISAPSPSVGAPVTKDINYYKSLIQQHGGERRDDLPQFAHQNNQPLGTSQEPLKIMKSRDSKPKIMKPCIFFNSSRGCRNGANCAYQHDVSSQQRIGEVQSAKRMKLDRGITGR